MGTHESAEDYSSWLLPAVAGAVKEAGLGIGDAEVFAVATGPGSFTGLRVGLTTVKAWGEVYGRPIAAVSRLEALAVQAGTARPYVAASFDAQRGQVFGALYVREAAGLRRMEDEMVIAPAGFLDWVNERTQGQPVDWISMDPERVTSEQAWSEHAKAGESVQRSSHVLAPVIGRIGYQRAREGRLVEALSLDADYVRRSDAEIFWKGSASHGR